MAKMVACLLWAAVVVAGVGCSEPSESPGGTGGSGGTGGTSVIPCTSDEECAGGEYCVGRSQAPTCQRLCLGDGDCTAGTHCLQGDRGATVCAEATVHDQCETDADCEDGWLCIERFCRLDSECTKTSQCADGKFCATGRCIDVDGTRCAGTADCYGEVAYCAATRPDTCLSLACGGLHNSCSRCAIGPNGGFPDPKGPLILAPLQRRVGARWCATDPEKCLSGASPFVCEFTFEAYDPDGDLPTERLGEHIRLVDRDGSLLTTFDGRVVPNAHGVLYEYTIRGCFADTDDRRISPAVVLIDRTGNHSQTQCMDGTL